MIHHESIYWRQSNEMNKIKLIALDMDGTLLNHQHEIAQETVEAINYARKKGVKVIIATGRPFNECYPYAKQLNLEDYIIVSNGAEIFNMKKQRIDQTIMEQHLIEKIWGIGEELQTDMWLISSEKVYYSNEPPTDFANEQWLKIGFANLDKQAKQSVLAQLQYFHDQLEISNSYEDNIEINKIGVNKAEAIRKVCEREGLFMEEVLVAGDGLNDEKMIQQAGIGVAMGNGQEAIKQIADYVTATNEENGVAKAIFRFV